MIHHIYELYKKYLPLIEWIRIHQDDIDLYQMDCMIVDEFASTIRKLMKGLGDLSSDMYTTPVRYKNEDYLLCTGNGDLGIKKFDITTKQFSELTTITKCSYDNFEIVLYMIKNAEPLIPHVEETKRKYFSAIIELAKNVQLCSPLLITKKINESYASLPNSEEMGTYINDDDYETPSLVRLILFGGEIKEIDDFYLAYKNGYNADVLKLKLNYNNLLMNLPFLEPVMPQIEDTVSNLKKILKVVKSIKKENEKILAQLKNIKEKLENH